MHSECGLEMRSNVLHILCSSVLGQPPTLSNIASNFGEEWQELHELVVTLILKPTLDRYAVVQLRASCTHGTTGTTITT